MKQLEHVKIVPTRLEAEEIDFVIPETYPMEQIQILHPLRVKLMFLDFSMFRPLKILYLDDYREKIKLAKVRYDKNKIQVQTFCRRYITLSSSLGQNPGPVTICLHYEQKKTGFLDVIVDARADM